MIIFGSLKELFYTALPMLRHFPPEFHYAAIPVEKESNMGIPFAGRIAEILRLYAPKAQGVVPVSTPTATSPVGFICTVSEGKSDSTISSPPELLIHRTPPPKNVPSYR